MDKREEITNYALCFAEAITEVLREEDSANYIEIKNDNATDVMTGLVLGTGIAFSRLTDAKCNHLEFTHLANRLVVQFLMKYGELTKDE